MTCIRPFDERPVRPHGDWEPVTDWTQLPGLFVEICARGRLLDCGTVDMVTSDGSILWLEQEGVSNRRIIEKDSDVYAQTLLLATAD